MENTPTGAGPIESAVSDIRSVVSLFSQLKSASGNTLAVIRRVFLYASVAWWIFAGAVGFIRRRRKERKAENQ